MTFTQLDYDHHVGCLIRNMNCLLFASTWVFGCVSVCH